MKLDYGKTFLLGFGFFGVSVIWTVYNAFVPLFLAGKFNLEPGLIGFFMTLDNVAALFIQPPVGAWSDRLRTPIGRRMPFILVGAPIGLLTKLPVWRKNRRSSMGSTSRHSSLREVRRPSTLDLHNFLAHTKNGRTVCSPPVILSPKRGKSATASRCFSFLKTG